MDFDVNDLGPCKKRVQVTLEAAEVESEFQRSYSRLRGQVVLPGFRPGKAPRRVLERRFGEQVKGEVTEELIKKHIDDVVSSLKLELVSPPELVEQESLKQGAQPGEELVFSFDLETRPEFELPEYKGVEVSRTLAQVTPEMEQDLLGHWAEEKATWQPAATDTYEAGDEVCASLVVKAGDELILEEEEVRIRASQHEVEGFILEDLEAALEGAQVGARLSLKATRVSEKETAQLDAEIEILEFKRRVVPELDDELAQELGHDSLEDMRKKAHELLARQAELEADEHVVSRILAKLSAATELSLPEGPCERMLERRCRQAALELLIAGVAESDIKAKVEENKDQLRTEIEDETRRWMILEKIAAQEKIFALEDDVDEKLQQIARESGTTPTRVRERYEEQDRLSELRAAILEQKTCAYLLQQARITAEDEGQETPDDASEDSSGESEASLK